MIFLATVFPVPLDEDDDDPNAEIPFDFLILDLLVHNFALGTWTALVYKAVSTFGLSLVTLQMYVGMTSLTDKY